jgi:anti-sigma regulatory factor (Ser/Thr protein kinase)
MYERERAVARTLQRSLLPEILPTPPGFRLAARYVPAGGGEVGGDWYDAFMLPNGSIAVGIGDVVGRGLGAASTMGKLRNALRAYALDVGSPGDVLDRMDRLLQLLDPEQMATVLYGVIDPVELTFRFASAAHIPPILRDADGSVRIRTTETDPPLGARQGGTFTETVEQLRPGTTLILCTDGLIERRRASLDDGLRRLCEASAVDVSPEKRCDLLIEELMDDHELDDDVALLVVEVAPDGGEELQTTFRADARQLLVLRRLLQRWLRERGLAPDVAYDVIAATGEAAANAIQHAYGPTGGMIHVGAEVSGDSISFTVRDLGRWRFPRDPDRGRGLAMMQALADEVRISRSETGTSVELRWRLEGNGDRAG